MTSPKPYFLLSEVASGEYVNKLLGRAVPLDQLKRPTEGDHFPILPPEGPDLRMLDATLYPKQNIKAKDARVLLSRCGTTEARLGVKNVIALFHKNKTATRREASIPGFRRLTMDQPRLRIEKLLKHEDYSTPILEYFNRGPDGKLGIVVSIICAMDMSLDVESHRSRETGGEVTMPVEALGAPPEVNPTLKVTTSSERVAETEGTYEGEVIVACGYILMTRKQDRRLMSYLNPFERAPTTRNDIEITSERVQPGTLTVTLPSTRIEGDQPAILGGLDAGDDGDGDEVAHDDWDDADFDDDGVDSDMILYE